MVNGGAQVFKIFRSKRDLYMTSLTTIIIQTLKKAEWRAIRPEAI